MENLTLIQSLFLIFILLIITVILLLLLPLLRKKRFKTKEENLIIYNQISTLIILSMNIIYIIFWYIGRLLIIQKILYKLLNYSFNVYIVFFYVNNYMVILDYYYTYSYPIHYFSCLLKIDQNFKNYYETFFLSLIIVINLFDIIYCQIDFFQKKLEAFLDMDPAYIFQCNDFNKSVSHGKNKNIFPLILVNNYFKGSILIIMSVLTISHILIILWKNRKFCFYKNESLAKNLRIKLIINCFYLLFSIANFFEKNEENNLVISFLFLVIIFMYNLILLIKYSLSKFVQLKLNKSIIGRIGLLLNKHFIKKTRFLPLTLSTDYNQNISSLLLMENYYNSFNPPLNSFEQELLLMYQNDFFLSDHYLNFFDQYLNIITSSLYKLYNSENFSTKEANNQRMSKIMNISLSSIPGVGASDNSLISGIESNEELIISDNLISFTFYKNKIINDYFIFDDVLNNNNLLTNLELRVNIIAYYSNLCVNNISEKNYLSKDIANSLISHMFIKNSNSNSSSSIASSNQDIPPCNYLSLTAANSKELYFKNLNSICFKTFDKKYTLEMFETNEEQNELIVSSSNKTNNNISEIISKYFLYLESKGINNTFLPLILGIFKIKINDFKPILIILTDNSLVENVPIKNYTNWQLIRFKKRGVRKVGSSRYTRNTIVDDDLIFKRVNWNENKGHIDCKIKLINYEEVKNIMLSDINFLKSSGCNKFCLLLMYYEYESNQKHEPYKRNAIIKIKSTIDNKPEIINEILPKDFLYDDDDDEEEEEDSFLYKINENKENENKENKENDENNNKQNLIEPTDNININLNINKNNSNKNIENNNNQEPIGLPDNININLNINDNNSNENKTINTKSTINSNSKVKDDIKLINENISDDANIVMSKGMNENIIKYSEQINFNGYPGVFDNFNCLCFFTFENIFQNQKNYQYNYGFYKNYLKKIMKYFTSLKENENTKENIENKNDINF